MSRIRKASKHRNPASPLGCESCRRQVRQTRSCRFPFASCRRLHRRRRRSSRQSDAERRPRCATQARGDSRAGRHHARGMSAVATPKLSRRREIPVVTESHHPRRSTRRVLARAPDRSRMTAQTPPLWMRQGGTNRCRRCLERAACE